MTLPVFWRARLPLVLDIRQVAPGNGAALLVFWRARLLTSRTSCTGSKNRPSALAIQLSNFQTFKLSSNCAGVSLSILRMTPPSTSTVCTGSTSAS